MRASAANSAVSTVNVQPKIEASRDFADLWKRIESAGRHRSSVGHYANRQMSGSAIFFNRGSRGSSRLIL